MSTAIEWTDETWNPVTGCTKVSPGCKFCYAERVAKRYHWSARAFTDVRVHAERLDRPLRWRRPRRVFVNSMSDLFHEAVADEFIDRIFAVMALAPSHAFQILTKRPKRMAAYCTALGKSFSRLNAARPVGWAMDYEGIPLVRWPLPNVWLGVSVEDQARADERIPWLLKAPAAVRFLSVEPLLGPVDLGLGRWVRLPRTVRSEIPFKSLWATPGVYRAESNSHGALSVRSTGGTLLGVKPDEFERLPLLDWVIVGGESGGSPERALVSRHQESCGLVLYGPPAACCGQRGLVPRPEDLAWVRSLRDQCVAAGVPFFFKQWGGPTPKAGGRILDGRTWDEYPKGA